MQEIERKYLVSTPPPFAGYKQIEYERYFLQLTTNTEVRIQRKNDRYEREEKIIQSALEATKHREIISREEFERLRPTAIATIRRDKIDLSENPRVSLTIYHGAYQGLIRAEVEFTSLDEAAVFNPYPWFGKEITHTALARDRDLCQLNPEQFQDLLREYS